MSNTRIFFENVELSISPCLTTLIGGRGSGKSTVIEYLRHALDRARRDDLTDDEPNDVRQVVQSVLSSKNGRDFGDTEGTLLPDYEITADIVVAERAYRVFRSSSGIEVVQDPDQPGEHVAPLDVRSLIAPRILSQKQIAQIARDPASQRGELDALIDPDDLREIANRRQSLVEIMSQLQGTRTRLQERGTKVPSVETELQKVRDQITFLEGDGRKEVLERFDALEGERRWLEDTRREVERLASELDDSAEGIKGSAVTIPLLPESSKTATWLESVANRVLDSRQAATSILRDQARALRTLLDTIGSEQADRWLPAYDESREAYETLRQAMTSRGVDFAQHEKLLQKRAFLERDLGGAAKNRPGARRRRAKAVRDQGSACRNPREPSRCPARSGADA